MKFILTIFFLNVYLCAQNALAFISNNGNREIICGMNRILYVNKLKNTESAKILKLNRVGQSKSSHSLYMGNIFDDIGKFFNDFDREQGSEANTFGDDNNDVIDVETSNYDNLGMFRILKLPVTSVKVGGLRLFLSLYLMGQLNTPEKGSWKTNQVGDGEIELFFRDQTGAIIIRLEDKEITIDRLGSTPSTQYLMYESMILNGLLDQLHEIITDDNIEPDDRLINLNNPGDAIDKARGFLSFS